MTVQNIMTDTEIVALVHRICGIGEIKLIFKGNDGLERPTQIAKDFVKEIQNLTATSQNDCTNLSQ
jgi:hypothetical protein